RKSSHVRFQCRKRSRPALNGQFPIRGPSITEPPSNPCLLKFQRGKRYWALSPGPPSAGTENRGGFRQEDSSVHFASRARPVTIPSMDSPMLTMRSRGARHSAFRFTSLAGFGSDEGQPSNRYLLGWNRASCWL